MHQHAPEQMPLSVINRCRRIKVDAPTQVPQIFHHLGDVDVACLTAVRDIKREITKLVRAGAGDVPPFC